MAKKTEHIKSSDARKKLVAKAIRAKVGYGPTQGRVTSVVSRDYGRTYEGTIHARGSGFPAGTGTRAIDGEPIGGRAAVIISVTAEECGIPVPDEPEQRRRALLADIQGRRPFKPEKVERPNKLIYGRGWKWGTEEYASDAEVEHAVAQMLADYLDENDIGYVEAGGTRFRMVVRVTLIHEDCPWTSASGSRPRGSRSAARPGGNV